MLHLQVRAIYEKRCESCLALLSHARELFHQEPDTVRTDKGKNNSRQHSCSLHSLTFFFVMLHVLRCCSTAGVSQ